MTCNATFASADDNLNSLGNSTHRWKTLFATNGTINTSDRRDKENIIPIPYGLETIMKLNPVSFTWKGDADRQRKLGLIAQEMQELLPEVVADKDWVTDEKTGKTTSHPAPRLGICWQPVDC